ncbi:hypothetical protein GCM10009632_47780 [Mycolicibacterium alvei]|uniref:Uncharacterized protein n=2 Tax=Mycolicibacterium alvei TaxID=67081 RepID=A0A6N4V466_9MYCO|nr:hypothetical protein MALV_57790 [Mycolicibacterium alvei]
MSDLAFRPAGEVELPAERAQRRAAALTSSVSTMFRTLAEIYRDEDWRHLSDHAGAPYTTFTGFVQDHLGVAGSYARRYQQGITGLILPLQELALPGTQIPVTSADVARLGLAGAQAVVDQAPAVLADLTESSEQTTALRELIDRLVAQPPAGATPAADVPALGNLVPTEIPEQSSNFTPTKEETSSAEVAGPPWSDSTGDEGPPWAISTPEDVDADDERSTIAAPRAANADTDSEDTEDVGGSHSPPDDEPAAGESSSGASANSSELAEAIATVLRSDPVALARTASPAMRESLASNAVVAAQRLSRLGQLLHSLTPSPGRSPSSLKVAN